MNRARLLLVFLLAPCGALLLSGCPTDSRREPSEYLRSPVSFRIDPVPEAHPYCLSAETRPDGMAEAECFALSKYRMRWERPEDTVGFREYRIYLDTTPPNSTLPWALARKERSLASYVLEGLPGSTDSIVFFLADTGAVPRVLSRAQPGLVALDTTGRRDSVGQLVFAITTAYHESRRDGLPRYSWMITDDRFPPGKLVPLIEPKARGMEIAWDRPRDPTSFFEPGADSGIILAYYLRIVRTRNRPGTFDPVVTYIAGGVDRTAEVDTTSFRTSFNAPGRLFRLPDSMRIRNRLAPDPLDSLRVTVTGLWPQDTVDVGLWAVDVAGNVSQADSSAYRRIILTDTTQPTTPVLRVLDSTRNGFVYEFSASRDLVESGSGLVPASEPNANILHYRITRIRLSGAGGGPAVTDTTLLVTAARRADTVFRDTARHLPPGGTYRILVRAVDSTEHASLPDSITVSTLPASFAGPDSGASCPPGFVAVPGGYFLRGDTVSADETPRQRLYMQSFCIEPYEHRDGTGAFAARKTWQQAHDACAEMADALGPADSTWLCTEAEWERACEGAEPDEPLVYGMLSERTQPGNVRFACNVGTNDSAMAMSLALRDPTCLSYEGVYDMAGNLAEWVLDPYTPSGYPANPGDTIRRGTPHTPPTSASVRVFRGSHYLNPNQPPATLLARARCSNRDFATQARPRPYPGCVSASGPQIAVSYATKPPRCLPLPENVAAADIDTIVPSRDSSQVLILLKGDPKPLPYLLPHDTAYAQPGVRPILAGLTRRTLAVVSFVNTETSQTVADTLHAEELLGRSEAQRALVFAREAAPPWEVEKSGGTYAITWLYAHVQTLNVPAKSYYSNAVLGFRCCAKPRP